MIDGSFDKTRNGFRPSVRQTQYKYISASPAAILFNCLPTVKETQNSLSPASPVQPHLNLPSGKPYRLWTSGEVNVFRSRDFYVPSALSRILINLGQYNIFANRDQIEQSTNADSKSHLQPSRLDFCIVFS